MAEPFFPACVIEIRSIRRLCVRSPHGPFASSRAYRASPDKLENPRTRGYGTGQDADSELIAPTIPINPRPPIPIY